MNNSARAVWKPGAATASVSVVDLAETVDVAIKGRGSGGARCSASDTVNREMPIYPVKAFVKYVDQNVFALTNTGRQR
jgi:hypothetical protein